MGVLAQAFVEGRGRGIALALASALGLAFAGLFLAVGHAVVLANDRQELQAYSQRLFSRALAVAAETGKVLNADWTTAAPCSQADLDRMRYVIFYSRSLRDVGRIDGVRLLCSAGWGALPPALRELPPAGYALRDLRFWSKVSSPAHPQVISDLAARNGIVVATSPDAFDLFASPPAGIGAKVVSADGRHEFEAFGTALGVPYSPSSPWQDEGATLRWHRCDAGFAVCVVSHRLDSGLFFRPAVLPFGLALAGMLLGGLLGWLLVNLLRYRQSLPMRLRRLLQRQGLILHYQPLRRLRDGALVGAEVLARWRQRGGAWVPPDTFIPLAEELGLMGQLTRQVLGKALLDMRARLRADPGFYLSVNVAACDLLDRRFCEDLRSLAREHGVAPGQIVLEITERTTADYAELATAMRPLSRHGFRFAVDDFGTGYSNLGSLAQLPLDAVKVDRIFVKAIGTDSTAAGMFGPICSIARALRVSLIAEGIETAAQADGVLQWAPDAVGQGWFLGRPVPADAFPGALAAAPPDARQDAAASCGPA